MWVSLCKTLPGDSTPIPPAPPSRATPTLSSWSSYSSDYPFLKVNEEGLSRHWQILQREASLVAAMESGSTLGSAPGLAPGSTPTLYSLAMGAGGNDKASSAYAAMLEYAKQKGLFVCLFVCLFLFVRSFL